MRSRGEYGISDAAYGGKSVIEYDANMACSYTVLVKSPASDLRSAPKNPSF